MNERSNKGFVRKIPSILGILICLLLAPVLVMNLTIVIKSFIEPDKVPDFFGIKPFVVTTGSMETTIHGGDLVITKNVDPTQLKERDIISFKDGKSVVTHRIIGLTEKDGKPAFITKGDANNAEDTNPVTYEQVESIYLFKITGLGSVAMFMQKPEGMLVFIGIPICGFILYDIIRRRMAERKNKSAGNSAQDEIDRLRAELEAKNREQ